MPNPVLDQERAQYLRTRLDSSTKRQRLLPAWPRPEKEFPEVSLEVMWVRLSTLNHRTKSEQMRVANEQNRPDLFTADPHGPEAQAHQYQILAGQEGFEDLKADLKKRGQREPAVVTAEGVLINGNRRTAALRSLYKDDDHGPSQYISCLVLPADASLPEIVDLETELQVAREFKEDYTWVNEALLIEEIFEREDKDWKKVAARMRQREPDVRARFETLQELHQLVALSDGALHLADFVPNESAFTELAKHVRGKPAAEAASVRAAYFLGTLSGVKYRTLRHLRRPDASARVRQELEEDLTLRTLLPPKEQQGEKPDILDDVLGSQQAQHADRLGPILGLVARHGKSREVEVNGTMVGAADLKESIRQAVDVAAGDAQSDKLDEDALTAPIRHLESATKAIARVAKALPDARNVDGWVESEYDEQIALLKAELERLGL